MSLAISPVRSPPDRETLIFMGKYYTPELTLQELNRLHPNGIPTEVMDKWKLGQLEEAYEEVCYDEDFDHIKFWYHQAEYKPSPPIDLHPEIPSPCPDTRDRADYDPKKHGKRPMYASTSEESDQEEHEPTPKMIKKMRRAQERAEKCYKPSALSDYIPSFVMSPVRGKSKKPPPLDHQPAKKKPKAPTKGAKRKQAPASSNARDAAKKAKKPSMPNASKKKTNSASNKGPTAPTTPKSPKKTCDTFRTADDMYEYEPSERRMVFRPDDYVPDADESSASPKHCKQCHLKPCIAKGYHSKTKTKATELNEGEKKLTTTQLGGELQQYLYKESCTLLRKEYNRLDGSFLCPTCIVGEAKEIAKECKLGIMSPNKKPFDMDHWNRLKDELARPIQMPSPLILTQLSHEQAAVPKRVSLDGPPQEDDSEDEFEFSD